nr:hypothetical protein [Tanacetum cinerariifolium]
MEEGQFLRHVVSKQGIKASPTKIQDLTILKQPKTIKEVQSLNGKLVALNRFLSKSAEKSLSFFKTLKVNPKRTEFKYALKLKFTATNNEAEYEAIIARIYIAKEIKIEEITIFVDSQLVANQANGLYEAKHDHTRQYLQITEDRLKIFQYLEVQYIRRSQNKKVNALSKLASLTFEHLTKKKEEKIGDLYIIFGINPLSSKTLIDQWKPHSNSVVQLAAAITASVRIHMYPYISRDDCYYTDTDSVVLGNSLNEEELSPTELGKFKEEAQIKVGYFLAPKQYYYEDKKEDKETLKHKGAAKNYVKKETFEDMYKEPFQKKRL